MILSCSYLLWILILFKYMLIVAINLLFGFIPMSMDRMHVFLSSYVYAISHLTIYLMYMSFFRKIPKISGALRVFRS